MADRRDERARRETPKVMSDSVVAPTEAPSELMSVSIVRKVILSLLSLPVVKDLVGTPCDLSFRLLSGGGLLLSADKPKMNDKKDFVDFF